MSKYWRYGTLNGKGEGINLGALTEDSRIRSTREVFHQHHDTMRNMRVMKRNAVGAVRPVVVLVDGLAEVVEAVEVVESGGLGNISLLSVDPKLLGQLRNHFRVLTHCQDIVLGDREDVFVDELLPRLVECVVGQVAPYPLASVAGTVAVFGVCFPSDER